MISTEFSESKKLLIITPENELNTKNILALSKIINDHINQTDHIPNLLLYLSQIPHWDGFDALKTHFKLVKEHHKLIKKVAVVSDSVVLKILPYFMDHFVAAKVRRFPENKLEDAKAWAEAEDDHPGSFDLLGGFPRDVVAIKARGIITAQDYQQILNPVVEEKLKIHDRLKLLMILDDEFASWSEEAAWDDVRFGFSHMGDFSKIALVTDIAWVRHGAKIFAPLMRAQVHIFDVQEMEDAASWIRS